MLPSWTDREKKLVVALCVAVLCLLAVILVKGESWFSKESSSLPIVDGLSQQPQSWSDQGGGKAQATPPKREVTLSVLFVDVKGAIKNPGIYQLKKPARLYQVIQAAGGSTSDADLSKVNLVQEVVDGSMIYIPRKGEKQSTFFTHTNDGTSGSLDQSSKISINTASAKELEELPGIGPAKAEAIIQYREEHGPFQQVSDVAKVPGIGEKLWKRFQDQIMVP